MQPDYDDVWLRTRPDSAEASLARGALQKGPGILELRYVDAPRLTGDYTLSVQIERIPKEQRGTVWCPGERIELSRPHRPRDFGGSQGIGSLLLYRAGDMVTSGEDAIRAAEAHGPDIVLVDIAIHGSINGIGAAREIIGRLGIPVIFMTGYDDEETVRSTGELKPLAVLSSRWTRADSRNS